MLAVFSPDETFVLILGAVLALCAWIPWSYTFAVTGRRVRCRGRRWPLALTPLLCTVALGLVLRRWSSHDVSSDPAYQLFYLVMGLAWLGVFQITLRWAGLSARDEVCERDNEAAAWAIGGALWGGTFCFAGGNVGDGPGWWVVLFAALLATTTFFLLWWLVHRGSNLAETITIERDQAAGLRAAGFFLGTGLILGGAAAGDWISAGATVKDFAHASWPAALLAAAVTAVERSCQPTTDHTGASLLWVGWVPALVYAGAGLVALLAIRP